MSETCTVIVGAGFAGIAMAERLRRTGDEDFVILERAPRVGGVWRDNTYPGCACDVPSNLYSLSRVPNPNWPHSYSSQAEILAYLERTVEKAGLLPHLRLDTEMLSATWDAAVLRWRIETSSGELTARFLVSATGPLTEPALPQVPGAERFNGPAFHSARWDEEFDARGKRVAVVGTGASAIQIVPILQRQVQQLVVVQRTPPWVLPHPGHVVSPGRRRLNRALPLMQRAARARAYWTRELLAPGFTRSGTIMRVVERIARGHLRRQVADPALRSALTPSYRIGCKRILISNEWYPSLQEDNVRVVQSPLAELRPGAIVTGDGAVHEVDAVVYATGFDVASMPIASRVRGAAGETLTKAWNGRPRAYLGTTVAGFPNLFMLVGPNTGLGHNSMLFMIEAQTRYVVSAMRTVHRAGADAIRLDPERERTWNAALQARLGRTVWNSGGCSSWYLDRNGDNRTLWPTWTLLFWLRTRRVRMRDYHLESIDGRIKWRSQQPMLAE